MKMGTYTKHSNTELCIIIISTSHVFEVGRRNNWNFFWDMERYKQATLNLNSMTCANIKKNKPESMIISNRDTEMSLNEKML